MTTTEQELRELDAWIAEHVMGWKARKLNRRDLINHLMPPQSITDGFGKYDADPMFQTNVTGVPNYTTEPAAAMEVLKKCMDMAVVTLFEKAKGGYEVRWQQMSASAETLELAICLFAKKLFTK